MSTLGSLNPEMWDGLQMVTHTKLLTPLRIHWIFLESDLNDICELSVHDFSFLVVVLSLLETGKYSGQG